MVTYCEEVGQSRLTVDGQRLRLSGMMGTYGPRIWRIARLMAVGRAAAGAMGAVAGVLLAGGAAVWGVLGAAREGREDRSRPPRERFLQIY